MDEPEINNYESNKELLKQIVKFNKDLKYNIKPYKICNNENILKRYIKDETKITEVINTLFEYLNILKIYFKDPEGSEIVQFKNNWYWDINTEFLFNYNLYNHLNFSADQLETFKKYHKYIINKISKYFENYNERALIIEMKRMCKNKINIF